MGGFLLALKFKKMTADLFGGHFLWRNKRVSSVHGMSDVANVDRQWRCEMKRRNGVMMSSFMLTTFLVLMSLAASPAMAERGADPVRARLQTNAKLHLPDGILADFDRGEPETAVIIHLKPTAAATSLAAHSRKSGRLPAEFIPVSAPAYYDLHDESVKTELRSTVTDTVGSVIDQLGASEITVSHRFSYQFGFAARVTPAALERIVNSPDVLLVEKDAILQAHLAQGIPLMNATIPRSSYNGSGLSIAICDTGIDSSHPALGGGAVFPNSKVIGGYDTGDNDADPRPNGQNHGTCCAGIAAGYTGTVGDYIGGVAPGAKLYSIKISAGATGSASTSAMIAGWEWAVTHKNDDPGNPILVISTSFGGGSYSASCDSASPGMTTAAANAVAAGITLFASSGNDGFCGSMAWPACISYVNSVGAVFDAAIGNLGFCTTTASCATKVAYPGCGTGSAGYVSWNSTVSDMVTSYSNSASFLTLLAPSHNAYTTDLGGAYNTTFGGTSAASPYAAGAAAVLQHAAKAKTGSFLTPAQVRSYLVSYGDSVTDSKIAITKPRVNLGRAVDAVQVSTYAITTAAGANGSISAGQTVNYNSSSAAVVVTPNSGYHIASVLVDGVGQSISDPKTFSYTFSAVTANHTVSVTFAIDTFTINTVAGANGTISAGQTVNYNSSSAAVVVTPNTGYHIASVLVDSVGQSVSNPKTFSYTFSAVTTNHTVSATFAIDTFTITTAAGANGTISAGQTVNYNSNSAAVVVTPNTGYHIASVLVDSVGQSISDPKSFSYTFSAVTTNHTVSATFAIDALTITTTSPLTNATVGTRYSRPVSATGGAAPYTWSLASGSLPTGLSLIPTTGYVAGIPSTEGAYSFTIMVTDSQVTPMVSTKLFNVSVAIDSPAIITVSPLTSATVGTRFSKSFNVNGGIAPYTWSIASGILPPGLSLIPTTGYLAGIPTAWGIYSFTVMVTDGEGIPATATKLFNLTVAVDPPAIITVSPLSSTRGIAYSKQFSVNGGVAPYTWLVASGTLPPGLTLSTQGRLTGTPITAGTYVVIIQAMDSQGAVASKAFTMTVN